MLNGNSEGVDDESKATLSFEAFCHELKKQFEIEGVVESQVRLHSDLRFDSLEMLTLLMWVEEIAQSGELLNDFPILETVDDTYKIYLQLEVWSQPRSKLDRL